MSAYSTAVSDVRQVQKKQGQATLYRGLTAPCSEINLWDNR